MTVAPGVTLREGVAVRKGPVVPRKTKELPRKFEVNALNSLDVELLDEKLEQLINLSRPVTKEGQEGFVKFVKIN